MSRKSAYKQVLSIGTAVVLGFALFTGSLDGAPKLLSPQKEAPPHVVRSGASDMSEDDSGANGRARRLVVVAGAVRKSSMGHLAG